MWDNEGHTPPLSFFFTVMAGGFLLRRIPKPSNSLVRIARSLRGLRTSKTINIRLQVLATAMTCRPRPLPSLAPSMIPYDRENSYLEVALQVMKKSYQEGQESVFGLHCKSFAQGQ